MCCHSSSALRSIPAALDIFAAIFSVYANFGVLSTNFLTAVDFSRLAHVGSRTSTKFTVMNSPIDAGMPIVA